MSNNPLLLFVAGPNGAGKSTYSKDLSEPGAIIFDVDKVIARIEAQSPGMSKKQVYDAATQEFFEQANEVYSGEMDHVIPWQTDQGIIWRTYVANTVKAFSKVVI